MLEQAWKALADYLKASEEEMHCIAIVAPNNYLFKRTEDFYLIQSYTRYEANLHIPHFDIFKLEPEFRTTIGI